MIMQNYGKRNTHGYDTIMQYDRIGDLFRFKTYPYNS